jgi:hypothetical protein
MVHRYYFFLSAFAGMEITGTLWLPVVLGLLSMTGTKGECGFHVEEF